MNIPIFLSSKYCYRACVIYCSYPIPCLLRVLYCNWMFFINYFYYIHSLIRFECFNHSIYCYLLLLSSISFINPHILISRQLLWSFYYFIYFILYHMIIIRHYFFVIFNFIKNLRLAFDLKLLANNLEINNYRVSN